MNVIKRIHLVIGLLIFLTFIMTGQYMHHQYDHLGGMEMMQRTLFRAGHLYILLFSLINLCLGAYYVVGKSRFKKWTQLTGSIIIVIATIICVLSFFKELPASSIERPISRLSLYLILAGVLLQLWPDRKEQI